MHEHTLNGVIHLFAVLASFDQRTDGASSSLVENYLTRTLALRNVEVYLGLFSDLLDYYAEAEDPAAPEKGITALCAQLDPLLSREDKQNFLLQALYIRRLITVDGDRPDALLDSVGEQLRIPEEERGDCRHFIHAHLETPDSANCRKLNRPDWHVRAVVFRSAWTGRCFLRVLSGACTLDENPLDAERFYPLEAGAILRDAGGGVVYRCEIDQWFPSEDRFAPIQFAAEAVNYRFPGSDNGLHDFSFHEDGGRMIGVMGGSGVGKSTLISILNGSLRPDSGRLAINGLDLYAEADRLEGVIGYVPQDDLLFEDLTVRENLDFSARLCLAHLEPDERRERVRHMLVELNQEDAADLKVGNPLSKTISGGQRKRLNIALELIREPSILLVDEPTSGLSSGDSDVVMGLLKAQASRGRLVIVIIHQPSSALFRLFDELWVLDRGGYPVYTGHPLEAARWFREQVHIAGADRSICPECGNVNPEQLFSILEARELDADGHFARERKYPPAFWHERWKATRPDAERDAPPSEPPPRHLSRPTRAKQAAIFFMRTLRARCANRAYLAVNLLEPPVLGGLTAWLCRASTGDSYILSDNPYLPVYLFMAIIVALFLGLSVSAEEIVRDRRVLRREQFLHLSWGAYAWAKIAYIAGLAGLQTAVCAALGAVILEWPGMGLKLWAALFSVAVFGGLLGLNVSARFKSAVTVYILIPLLLIPQMLLGGLIISYDHLRDGKAPNAFPPLLGELTASRWVFEALVVEQFQSNEIQQHFAEMDRALSRLDYLNNDLIPALIGRLDALYLDTLSPEERASIRRLLNYHLAKLDAGGGSSLNLARSLDAIQPPDRTGLEELKKALRALAAEKQAERRAVQAERHIIQQRLLEEYGEEGLSQRLKKHTNRAVTELVRNKKQLAPLRIQKDRIVQWSDPIYQTPDSAMGRAPFMAGHKRFGPFVLRTYTFDLAVVWLMNTALALLLLGARRR